MKRMLLASIGLGMMTQAVALDASGPNKMLLPSPFPVYVIKDAGVVNHPSPGATQVFLPTDNTYTGEPGCYIACYSHSPGFYMVSPRISVMGQIRVRGKYMIRICKPEGYQNMDISKSDQLKGLCTEKIKGCSNNLCWAGGDTGGWFGIQ
ncbi:hypothetical protein ACD661_04115 [Legionella lytica]|uniref:Uncharacterized protein n=1 Tax=Legionella lytica TaxID=96232 RepID=A0ABW8D4Y2_9GAMM